jgi:hypothetical protein
VQVRAAVFDDGKNRVALVGLDARRRSGHGPPRSQGDCKKTSMARTPFSSASHCTRQAAVRHPARRVRHASDLRSQARLQGLHQHRPEISAESEAAIIEAVSRRSRRRAAAKASIGRGVEKTVAFNRRFKMRDGPPSPTPDRAIPTSSSRPARPTPRSASSASGMTRRSSWAALSTSPATPPRAPAASRPTTFTTSKRRFRVTMAKMRSSSSSTAPPATSRR